MGHVKSGRRDMLEGDYRFISMSLIALSRPIPLIDTFNHLSLHDKADNSTDPVAVVLFTVVRYLMQACLKRRGSQKSQSSAILVGNVRVKLSTALSLSSQRPAQNIVPARHRRS